MKLAGKVALITGAGSGIGQATAELFAREGASVVIADLLADRAEAVATGIQRAGGAAIGVQADVVSAAAAQAMVMQTVAAFGGLDILVNNAGINLRGTVETMAEDDWDAVWALNVKAGFLCSKYAIPHLRQRGRGVVLFTSSAAGLAGTPGSLAYCASKAAIINMIKTMALDHGPEQIRVNCVCPFSTRTPMLINRLHADAGSEERLGATVPLGRIAEPEEIARAFLFLASDDGRYMSGQALVLDGGVSAGRPFPV